MIMGESFYILLFYLYLLKYVAIVRLTCWVVPLVRENFDSFLKCSSPLQDECISL